MTPMIVYTAKVGLTILVGSTIAVVTFLRYLTGSIK